jgi:hypothetical protein
MDLLHLIHSQLETTGNTAILLIYTLWISVAPTLGFSVFTSRILTTDLYQSHYNFKSHMKSSLYSLIIFLPLFCDCQFRRLDSIKFLCSEAHVLAGWRLETQLTQFFSTELFFTTILNRPCRKHSLFVVGKACLQSRCITTEIIPLLLAYWLPRECVYRTVA